MDLEMWRPPKPRTGSLSWRDELVMVIAVEHRRQQGKSLRFAEVPTAEARG